jgi:peptide chain release factor 3
VDPGDEVGAEAARRRTFAIISHPDAGKTTLTEKFLLYAGAVLEAGAVKARAGGRSARSDWMALERQRGISVSSTVLQFPYRDHVVNLLDTPGHRDFSEDTYRVLAAADAAVMVLDVAKGVEPQTRKLFEVCRSRNLPILTFLNKYDRPGRDPLELIDEIGEQIGLEATPVTWPVGEPGAFRGVIDRRDGSLVRYERTAHGSGAAPEVRVEAQEAAATLGAEWDAALEGCALLDEVGANHEQKSFLAGETSPLFVGSALTNFGVRHLLDAVVDLAPAPAPAGEESGRQRPIDSPFSGFVFKVQANMNPAHRDHVAFVRVCSGHFSRGMVLTHQGKPFATKYAASMFGADRVTVEDAWPGDIVGLVNARGLHLGDSLYESEVVTFPPIPSFAPELVASVNPRDVSRFKQFRKGLRQLAQEGVVQVLHRPGDDPNPVLAAVGQMQFEVFAYRMEHELGAAVDLGVVQARTVRRTDAGTAVYLREVGGVDILERDDGVLLAAFASPYWLARLEADHPEWTLASVVAA